VFNDYRFWLLFIVVCIFFGSILWFYEKGKEYSRIIKNQNPEKKYDEDKEMEILRREDLKNKLGIILRARRIQESEFLDMCNKIWQPKNKIESLDQLEDKEIENLISTYGVGVPGVGKRNG
jgi:hypothetical protein